MRQIAVERRQPETTHEVLSQTRSCKPAASTKKVTKKLNISFHASAASINSINSMATATMTKRLSPNVCSFLREFSITNSQK